MTAAAMHSLARHMTGLLALVTPATGFAGSANLMLETTGTPPEFTELASAREVLVDVYFGGSKVGEAFAVAKPGSLAFRSVDDLLAMVPQVTDRDEVGRALAAELPSHGEMVCSAGNSADCGILSPEVAGIIYDDARFRVDLFVNPEFLRTAEFGADEYLPVPDAPLGLTSSIGAAIAGSTTGATAYNVQNRTILGFHNARVRLNSSVASGLGLVMDDFVGELEHEDLRYSAGLFWAPGNDFIGQRRIIGGGVGTQFDTSADRDTLRGTPILLFLPQQARVELLIDGRLISSRSYSAGNVSIDTSALPDGSYTVLLRIQANGATREERRFFVKNAKAPPVGHPMFHAFAGMLANTRRHQPISPSNTFFYQAGAAWRLGNSFAADLEALGTQHKAIIEAGAWLIKPQGRMRVAALASTGGDAGLLVQISSSARRPLSFNFDLRRIWSHDGKPLIPVPTFVDSFRSNPSTGIQLANGSYTQANGSLGLRLGAGYLAVVASYRKDKRLPADYSIGPSVSWPVFTGRGVQLVLDASAQRTRTTTAAFAGARVLFTSGGLSMLGRLGHGSETDRHDSQFSAARMVGNLTAQYSHEDKRRTLVEVGAGVDRDVRTSTALAEASVYSRFGNLRADALQDLEGGGGMQYGVTLQSAMAATPQSIALGGRELEPSAIIVSVDGTASAAEFDVLIDGVAWGRVKAGGRFSLFVPGYRTYAVRLIPTAATSVNFDAAARSVTLYPGNVQRLAWKVDSYFTMFARAMSGDGGPIANALVHTAKSVAQTDSDGYFQIDARLEDPIMIEGEGGRSCQLHIPPVVPRNDFAAVGKVSCQ
jgi:hypothetical protein